MSKLIIVAGVSGSGKTTIGKLVAEKLSIPFKDGDDFHPQKNIDKMKSGQALNDEDRKPWLDILAKKLTEWSHEDGVVLACSALKEAYRQTLTVNDQVTWVFLEGSYELLESRMTARKNHFFKAELLKSQLKKSSLQTMKILLSVLRVWCMIGSLAKRRIIDRVPEG